MIQYAEREREIQIISLYSVTNWSLDKAAKAVRQCNSHGRNIEVIIRHLASGWSYRQALKFERKGVSPQLLNMLRASPRRN